MGGNIDLDQVALEIARKHLLEKVSFKELGRIYYASPSTIQRRLMKWLEDNRFDITDKLKPARPVVVKRDDRLAEELARKTGIWRARVVRISGLDEAGSGETTADDFTFADKASDELHRCLGEVAAELVINGFRRNMTIGLASGRGVGYTIDGIKEIADQTPSWIGGYENIRLVSMCGGAHLGGWQNSNSGRDFDADENVFALSSILKNPRKNVYYMNGPVLVDTTDQRSDLNPRFEFNLAVIGLGQLNAQHHYLRDHNDLQLKTLTEPIRRIVGWQSEHPDILDMVAEIVLKLYPAASQDLPMDIEETIRETNERIMSVSPEKIKEAGEVILVSGGEQKADVLHGVLTGKYPDTPIVKKNLTLVTDSLAAEAILNR
ncbi:sugar-binding domain-containing protein [Chloroflexota bacterium]